MRGKSLLCVIGPLLRHIWVGAIDNELDARMLACKILSEHNSHICLLFSDELLGFLWCWNGGCDGEVFRGCQLVDCRLCLMIHVRGHHHRAHIPNIGRDGKAEEQHQHDRHAEEDEHRTLVAQDVTCFLDNETDKLPHIIEH